MHTVGPLPSMIFEYNFNLYVRWLIILSHTYLPTSFKVYLYSAKGVHMQVLNVENLNIQLKNLYGESKQYQKLAGSRLIPTHNDV